MFDSQAVPAVSSLYGTGFPVMMFILIPLFLLNFFNRIFVFLKLPSMQFGTPIPNDEQLREGKRKLEKFKKLAERNEQRNVLKRYLVALEKSGGKNKAPILKFFYNLCKFLAYHLFPSLFIRTSNQQVELY